MDVDEWFCLCGFEMVRFARVNVFMCVVFS